MRPHPHFRCVTIGLDPLVLLVDESSMPRVPLQFVVASAIAAGVIAFGTMASTPPLLRVWETAGGGNGHAYETFALESPRTYAQAQLIAERRGARLVLPNSPSEQAFVRTLMLDSKLNSSWIDGWRDPDCAPGIFDAKSVPAEWLRDTATNRTLDIVVIGDSNVLFRTTGWDHGMQSALAGHDFLCAAIGPTPFNHDGGSAGWRWSKFIAPNGEWPAQLGNAATSTQNAPASLAQHLDFPGGFPNTGSGYTWLSSGSASVTGGLGIDAAHPFITDAAPLQFRIRHGLLPGGGSICPTAWKNYSAERISGGCVICDSPETQIIETSLSVSGALGNESGFRFTLDGGSGLSAPIFLSWASVERTDASHGWSVSVLDWHSGGTSRDIADDLDDFGGTTASEWVSLLRDRQARRGQAPRVLFVLSTGMNDLPLTADQHEEALRRMVARLDAIWLTGGGSSDETAFILKTSHDAQLGGSTAAFQAFRARAQLIAAERNDAATVDLGKVFMRPLYFPQDNGGAAHLTTLGYESISNYIIDAALGANGSGCGWQWGAGGTPTKIPWNAGHKERCEPAGASMEIGAKAATVWIARAPVDELRSLVLEYERDCDNDGVVDRVAVDLGLVVDANGDAIPDICQCLGDLNFDGIVDSADLVMLLGAWDTDSAADFDGSDRVDAADLVTLIDAWGECSPPSGG